MPRPEVPVAGRVGVDLVFGPDPLPFWLTMSCSPLDSPRLEIGNSGINVKFFGGYPAFTEVQIMVSPNELRWLAYAYHLVVRVVFP